MQCAGVDAYVQPNINPAPGLHCSPEVVCVEVPREFGIDVYNVHVALGGIANDSLVVFAGRRIGLDVDAEGAVELELQSRIHISICASLHMEDSTYTVASSPALGSTPPSTPSSSNSPATPPNLARSLCSLSPSISRSLACFAILNFSVSSLRISAAWFVGLCWLRVWLWFAESVWCVRFRALREDWMERRCWVRNSLSVLRDSFMR
jgi:hypothetical protein